MIELKSDLRKIWDRLERATLPLQPSVRTVKVGGAPIKIHSSNPLYWSYRDDPSLSRFMGHLAACVEQRWPEGWGIDIGANVGDTLALFRGSSRLPFLCIEGDDLSYSFLEQNARQFDRVHLLKTFLSDRNETVEVHLEKKGWNTTLVQNGAGGPAQTLRLQTLDSVVEAFPTPIKPVKLLKVDTEGYDIKILRGAPGILQADRPVLLFELNPENIEALHESADAFFDYLQGLGYSSHVFFDNLGNLLCTLHEPEKSLWLDFYRYARKGGKISHYDVCAFHGDDRGLALSFVQTWRESCE